MDIRRVRGRHRGEENVSPGGSLRCMGGASSGLVAVVEARAQKIRQLVNYSRNVRDRAGETADLVRPHCAKSHFSVQGGVLAIRCCRSIALASRHPTAVSMLCINNSGSHEVSAQDHATMDAVDDGVISCGSTRQVWSERFHMILRRVSYWRRGIWQWLRSDRNTSFDCGWSQTARQFSAVTPLQRVQLNSGMTK